MFLFALLVVGFIVYKTHQFHVKVMNDIEKELKDR